LKRLSSRNFPKMSRKSAVLPISSAIFECKYLIHTESV
jgi:hypothetical protein